jgi:hypothetical protein
MWAQAASELGILPTGKKTTKERFREMLVNAGFDDITFVLAHGGQATPDAPVFLALTDRRCGRIGLDE